MTSASMSPEAKPGPRPSLWQHRDFRRLWVGDTASQLGAALGSLAIPYLAVTSLGADAFQMGLLTALTTVGFLVIGLPAGAIVDRYAKRRIMIAADAGRAALLVSLPVAWAFGLLTFAHVAVVATLIGMLTVFFDVSYQSYLPLLVDRRDVVQGNAKLQASQSVSQAAGPALGGFLIKALGAPLVVAVNAVGYLASALALRRIAHREPRVDPSNRRRMRTEIAEGLRFVLRHPLLRRLVACTGIANMAHGAVTALIVLYMVRDLGFSAATIGLIESVWAVGGLLGAVLAHRLTRLVGEGPVIILSATWMLTFAFATPLSSVLTPIPTLLIGGAGTYAAIVVYNVATVSFRQRLCPPALLGRMNASARFIVWGGIPAGAFGAGVLAQAVGTVTTLWIACAVGLLAALPVLISPLWTLRTLPEVDAPAWSEGPTVNDPSAGR